MEISILPKSAIRIKSKTATFVLEPSESVKDFDAALYFKSEPMRDTMYENGITIDSPGEYEVGGVKITGTRYGLDTAYSMLVDGVSLLAGSLSVMEKFHGKMQEHDLVLIQVDGQIDPAFTSALATNGILFFGEHISELEKNYLKDEVSKMSKFVSTKEKLPQEMVTILLQ